MERMAHSLAWLLSITLVCIISLSECSVPMTMETSHPLAIEVTLGDNLTIHVKINNIVTDLSPYRMGWTTPVGLLSWNETNRRGNRKYVSMLNRVTGYYELTIHNVSMDDNSKFGVQISRDGEFAKSPNINVVVLIPPSSITIVGGATQIVVEGNKHNLTCISKGSNPAVSVEWLGPSRAVIANTVLSGSTSEGRHGTGKKFTNHTITATIEVIPNYNALDAEYVCKVSGRQLANPELRKTKLNVQYSPKVVMTSSPNRPHQIEKTKATFSCTAAAQPSAVTWKWFLDNKELPETSSSLTYSSIDHNLHNKKLKCQAANGIGGGYAVQPLNIHFGPRFTSVAADVEADLGDKVSLVCEVSGNPSPSIVWVKRADTVETYQGDQMNIYPVKESDFGKYECIGTVKEFPNIVHVVHLLKKGPPKIRGSTEFTSSQGQQAQIVCTSDCVPKPTKVIWTKGKRGDIIIAGSSSRFTVKDEAEVQEFRSTLTILDVASNDFDKYSCTIINERGRDSVILTLTQIDDFPWQWVLVGAGAVVVLAIAITIAVCCRKRAHTKTSSAGSLSVVSNTTDNSIKKPADGMEHIETSSLPDFGLRPIDRWRNNQEPTTTHPSFDSPDFGYDQKPELYGSFRASPCTTFNPQAAYPPGNYGSYRVQHPRLELPPAPQYSTLPLRPSKIPVDVYSRGEYGGDYNYEEDNEVFPEPPPAHRLATNV